MHSNSLPVLCLWSKPITGKVWTCTSGKLSWFWDLGCAQPYECFWISSGTMTMSWLSQIVNLFEPFMAWMSENETKFQIIKSCLDMSICWQLSILDIAFDIVRHFQKLDNLFHESLSVMHEEMLISQEIFWQFQY